MRKRLFVYICILMGSLVSCGKRSVPVFADADVLARSLYEKAGFETDAIYAEEVEDTDAFLFGVTVRILMRWWTMRSVTESSWIATDR